MDTKGLNMTPITAGLRISPVYTAPQANTAAVDSKAAAASVTAIPSTTVSLGEAVTNDDGRTYTARGGIGPAQVRYVLQNDSVDKLGMSLISGAQSSSLNARFQGIGAALLEQLVANGGQSVAQSAFGYTGETEPGAAALDAKAQSLREAPANAINLTLTTASGATITLSLASNEDGIAVSAEVQGGELNANELKGLASLTDSFQKAINGLTETPPRLELGSLVKLDPAVFSSVQMSARLETATGEQQTFELNLNDRERTVALKGPNGNVDLKLDTTDATLLDSSTQRQAAINSYLDQFDAAQRRGKGDENLVNLFKAAFVQLNSADDAGRTAGTGKPILTGKDNILLSGLADFTASISQPVNSINPLKLSETDRFDYKVSQSTTVRGEALKARSVQQDQTSSLEAAWHTSLNPMVALALGTDYESQNYRYHEVSDKASSSTRLAFDRNDKRTEASATQQASSNERVRTYVNGQMTDDVSTPKSESKTRDLLGLLNTAFEQERVSQRDRGLSILEAQLSSSRNQWGLQADPSSIKG